MDSEKDNIRDLTPEKDAKGGLDPSGKVDPAGEVDPTKPNPIVPGGPLPPLRIDPTGSRTKG